MQSIMKRFFLCVLVLCFLYPGVTLGEEPGTAIDSTQSNQQTKEVTPSKEPAPQPPLPPPIPPASSFTPEQVKKFKELLSKQKPSPEEEYIILNFDDADLRDVVNTISSITKENFILSPGLNAKITIHSSAKIPRSEALDVFESILEVNNMTLVRSGRFYKIVPGAAIKQKPTEVIKGKKAEDFTYEDRPITQIIPVEYVPVGELTPLIQPMLSQFGSVIPNPRNNLLIISDLKSSIKRILTVLKEVDVNAFQDTRMFFFQPRYSDVNTLADELTEIINALNLGRDGNVAIVPIERINSLIVFCSSSSLLETLKKWIKKLDEEVTTGQNIFVYSVQNVDAKSIAEILKKIYIEDDTGKAKTRVRRRVTTTQTRRRTTRTTTLTTPLPEERGRVEIVTFEPTNSLVILAPPGVYRDIVETIKKLDVYPQEVLIEVIIAEVTLSDTEQFGIQWSVLNSVHIEGDPDFTELIRTYSTNAPSPTTSLSLDSALSAGGLYYTLYKPDRLLALLHALATKGRVRVLSSPRLLVRDQEEATIEVGSEIPTATSTTTAVETTTLTQNIEYKTVGIKLKIKPTINDERTVVLDVEQEVSDVFEQNRVVGGFTYPEFSTRKAKTSIIVPDKQGIVIGGIIKEKKDKSYQGIPILSSIPILGYLFRYTVDVKERTELVILLTPHVITNRTEADVLTMEFMRKLSEVRRFLEEEDKRLTIRGLEEKDNKNRPIRQ
jgi:general secretion pathway protein D